MVTKRAPGPSGGWFFGELSKFNQDSLTYMEHLAEEYGDIASVRFGPFLLYYFNHPDTIREVFVTKAKSFDKSMNTKRALMGVSHPNLFSSDGEYWKKQRKLAQPAFHSKRISAYADVMVHYASQMVANWADKDSLDIDREMANVTMNIVVKALFDVDLRHETGDLQEAMLELFGIIDKRIQRVMPVPMWLPTEENRRLKWANSILQERIGGIVEERRQSEEDHGDLLSMLLMAQDEDTGLGMSDKEVYNEVLTLFAAGHETTANTLMWTFYLLSQHPEISEALHEQIDAVLGDRPATLEDLRALPLTEQIIKEALRLYPPAWAISRQANEAVEIADYHLAKRDIVIVSPWTLHRHPDFWDNPEEFRPSRFNEENEPNIPRYAYFPFGGGPRVCIGNSFAMMEAQLVLTTVVQHYRLNLAPQQVVEPERRFTLTAKYGMKMLPEKRERVMIPA